MNIDLGCGKNKKPGYIGFDLINADISCNLDSGIPCHDNSVDKVYTSHFLEHIENPVFMIGEIYRVLKTGGTAEIIVPHFSNIGAYHCLHKTFWNVRGLDFIEKSHPHHFYSDKINFKILQRKIEFRHLHIFEPIINIKPKISRMYEHWLSSIFRAYQIRIIIQKED